MLKSFDQLQSGFRIQWKAYDKEHQCLGSVLYNFSDLSIVPVAQSLKSNTLLPFMTSEYGVYYKIKEFHVSPTFFIDGMSHDLWMFSFITLFLIFVGFLTSTKVHCQFLKRSWVISDVFMYQANFWCNQPVTNYLDKFLSWRIQLITGFVFNIIIMTAFSAKFVGLMSIRHFEQPFSTMEDFAVMKTHSLCVSPSTVMIENFKVTNSVEIITVINNSCCNNYLFSRKYIHTLLIQNGMEY